jgi:hypothetical protein
MFLRTVDTALTDKFFGYMVFLFSDEVLLLMGGARRKYADMSTSYEMLTRRLHKSNNPQEFSDNLKKVEAVMSYSRDKKTKKIFSKNSLLTWIMPNPRSPVKAYFGLKQKMDRYIKETVIRGERDEILHKSFKRLETNYYSELHKAYSASRKVFSMVDIDTKDLDVLKGVYDVMNDYVIFVTETKNGYHVLYNVEGNKIVYREQLIEQYQDGVITIIHDPHTYVWGTYQGDFMVRPYENKKWGLEVLSI